MSAPRSTDVRWERVWRETEAAAEQARQEAAEFERHMLADVEVLVASRRPLKQLVELGRGWLRQRASRLPNVKQLKRAGGQRHRRDMIRWLFTGLMRGQIAGIFLGIPIVYLVFYPMGFFFGAQWALRVFGPDAWWGIAAFGIVLIVRLVVAKS